MPEEESVALLLDASGEDESDLGNPSVNDAVLFGTDWTVGTLINQIENGRIYLTPIFQRRDAWNDARKSKFIESLMLELPVPQLVLAEQKNQRGTYLVVDGKQRLLTLRKFASSEAERSLRLSGLEILRNLNRKTLVDIKEDEADSGILTQFENHTIRTVVIKNWPNEDFLYLVFLRLNQGSLPLSPQELRQALNPGEFVRYADEYSAESQGIKRALGIDEPDYRMRDVEIFVRYFSFVYFLPNYDGNLKRFLDLTCKNLNESWADDEASIRRTAKSLESAIDVTIQVFGEQDAFTRWYKDKSVFGTRFNRATFDVMTFYFRRANIAKGAIARKEKVVEAYQELTAQDEEFDRALESTTKSIPATYKRLRAWGDKLSDTLSLDFERPSMDRGRIRI